MATHLSTSPVPAPARSSRTGRVAGCVLSLVLVTAALGACGGGSKTLSKSEFIKQADAICKTASADAKNVAGATADASATDVAGRLQKVVDIIDPALGKLDALTGAKAQETVLDEDFIRPNRALIGVAREFATALTQAGSDTTKQQQAATTFAPKLEDPQRTQHDKALADAGFVDCSKTNAS
jgi:hypothetical protein